jgi:putative Mg2+ transporter-C (MgtC) family protein
VVAAIGMACGAGLLWEAIALTVLTLVVLVALRFIEPFITPTRASVHRIEVKVDSVTASRLIGDLYDFGAQHHVKVEALTVIKENETELIKLVCKVQDKTSVPRLLDELRAQAGVHMVDVDLKGS